MSRIVIPDPQGANVVDKGSDLARIYNAATAFWQSAVLFAACRLGVLCGTAERNPGMVMKMSKRTTIVMAIFAAMPDENSVAT